MQRLRGAGRDEARQVVPGADRLELGRARRDHDLVGMDVEHPAARPGDDRGTGIDRDHLVTGAGVEDDHGSAGGSRSRLGLEPGRPATHDRDVHLEPADLDRHAGRRRPEVRPLHDGERRHVVRRMADDDHPRARRRLARPNVGDAVDLGQAIAAIAGQAQRATTPWDHSGAQDGDRHGITRLESDRPPIDDDPAARHGRRAGVGHWRIREPVGSNSGSGWSLAGRRRPMISISNPAPPGPSGDASAVGTYPSAIDRLTWWP